MKKSIAKTSGDGIGMMVGLALARGKIEGVSMALAALVLVLTLALVRLALALLCIMVMPVLACYTRAVVVVPAGLLCLPGIFARRAKVGLAIPVRV